MLNEQERSFVEYWEARRLKEKDLLFQVLTGLPVGLLFSLPIMFILFSGKWWHKRADMVANSSSIVWILVIAVLIIAVFVAVLYKRHQWEMKEQQYMKLKARMHDKS